MTENMLTIDRLFDFGVLGFLDTCRLSDIGVVRPFKVCRLSDTGVFEVLKEVRFQQTPVFVALAGCFAIMGSLFGIKKQEDRSSRPSCWVIYAIARYAVARGTLKFVSRCSCVHCAATHCGYQRLQGLQEAMLCSSSFFVPLKYAGVF